MRFFLSCIYNIVSMQHAGHEMQLARCQEILEQSIQVM